VRLIAHAHEVVQALFDGGQREARAIISDGQALRVIDDRNVGRHPRALAGIEGVVQEFFEEGKRPLGRWKAQLHG
jgi:hypothetical protein